MEWFNEMSPELRRGLILSTLFHLVLAFLFMLAKVGGEVNSMPFAEVTFISGTPGGQITTTSSTGPSSAPQTNEVIRTPAPQPAAKTEPRRTPRAAIPASRIQPAQQTSTEPRQSAPVLPPKRRMMEEEEPLLSRQAQDKLSPGRTAEAPAGSVGAAAATDDRGARETASSSQTGGSSTGRTEGGVDQGGGGSGQGSGINQGGGAGQPFTIEGDAAQRLIVKQIIPAYPDGLQQEAVIQFRFTVQPDGRLTGLIPMRKGDPTLEKITLAALRQWLFNPLPDYADQKSVQGIITFRYQLE